MKINEYFQLEGEDEVEPIPLSTPFQRHKSKPKPKRKAWLILH